jgi:prepilin-type N-terminal cleavage/methylation domain-containing protein
MQSFSKRARQHRDAGMTLPELLISVTLTGILATTLALATNVMLSNKNNTLGRANNSRSEQNVGLFMPTDLASSESENTDPWAVPCGPTAGPDNTLGTADDVAAPACPPGAVLAGSNALLLKWTSSTIVAGNPVTTTTLVSYRVALIGTEYQLLRVKCDSVGAAAPTCTTQIVLHNLTPPQGTFRPGIDSPSWIITVSKATAADDTSGASAPPPTVDPGLKNKNGQRVVVTVNGGGGGTSASGGQSQIFLSAGGTNRQTNLSTEDLTGAPTFTAARSRCGGNIGMVVDTSNSITNAQMKSIKAGIQAFLDEFAGTPVKLQIVTFSTVGTILGSAAGEAKWYDMLVDSDVAALKTLIGDPNNSNSGIRQNGGTNWEDGFLRMLRNQDGTIPAQLPSKVIVFTDGVPTFDRSADDDGDTHTSATAPIVADPADAGLDPSTGSSYSQLAWNRAERVIRDRGKVDVIGIFVGTLPGTSDSDKTNHLPTAAYEDWSTSQGYHDAYAAANTVAYQRNANIVWEKGYHLLYERNNNIVYEKASTNMTYKQGSTTKTQAQYLAGNTTPDGSDGWTVTTSGTPGGTWTSMTVAQYDATNTTTSASDGWRVRLNPASLNTNWTTITAAQYTGSNTTSDSTDGWRVSNSYTAPFDTWAASTQTAYDPANTTVDGSDGWRTRVNGSLSGTWTTVPVAQYAASNSTADSSDGWRTTTSGSSSSWTWSDVTLADYNASNTTGDSSDGWKTYHSYTTPYTGYDVTTKPVADIDLLGNVIVGDLSGNTGAYNRVDAPTGGAPYADNAAAAADVFALPDYSYFAQALDKIVLGECGGTVTLQTKNTADNLGAKDPFTYQNSTDNTVVKTSSAFKSGTFDVAFPGENAKTITITPQEFTNLTAWTHTSWSCKSKGVAYPFTETPVPDHTAWTSITLTVHANEAISCTQMVTYHG